MEAGTGTQYQVNVTIFDQIRNATEVEPYSRTGNYKLGGYPDNPNANVSVSYYFFFENEPEIEGRFLTPTKPCFNGTNVNIEVPCRTTNVVDEPPQMLLDDNKFQPSVYEFTPEHGFKFKKEDLRSGTYTCVLPSGAAQYFVVDKSSDQVCVKGQATIIDNSGWIWYLTGSILLFLVVVFVGFVTLKFQKKAGGLSRAEIAEFKSGGRGSIFCTSAQIQMDEESGNFTDLNPYNQELEVSASRFQLDRTCILGEGEHGVVYKGLLDGRPVAIKTVRGANNSLNYTKSLLKEIKVMDYLGRHENLVELLGANTTDLGWRGIVYLFVDLCPLGSLEQYLRVNRNSTDVELQSHYSSRRVIADDSNAIISLKDLYIWSTQIANGMAYLAKKKVVHGDLAARNVLLTAFRTVKITDFGLSRKLYEYLDYTGKNDETLPWRWLALESLQSGSFSTKSDVWSYGITLWEIFSMGDIPYPGWSFGPEFTHFLMEGHRACQPRHASEELYDSVMAKCWSVNRDERPNFDEILASLKLLSNTIKTKRPSYVDSDIIFRSQFSFSSNGMGSSVGAEDFYTASYCATF